MGRVYSQHWNTHWNPRDQEKIRNNANVYNRWGSGAVMSHKMEVSPGAGTGRRGDVYAGKDGRVYEHTQSGWVQHDNAGKPKPVQPMQSRGLDQQRQARSMGQSRAMEFGSVGHSMGMPRMGGGFGGGGRRR